MSIIAKAGPFPLPGTGKGTLTKSQIDTIKNATEVATRVRHPRNGASHLVASGPAAKLDEGLAMAKAFILESQVNGRGEEDLDDDDQGPDDLGKIEEPQPSRPHRRSQQQQQQPAHVGMQMPFVAQPTMNPFIQLGQQTMGYPFMHPAMAMQMQHPMAAMLMAAMQAPPTMQPQPSFLATVPPPPPRLEEDSAEDSSGEEEPPAHAKKAKTSKRSDEATEENLGQPAKVILLEARGKKKGSCKLQIAVSDDEWDDEPRDAANSSVPVKIEAMDGGGTTALKAITVYSVSWKHIGFKKLGSFAENLDEISTRVQRKFTLSEGGQLYVDARPFFTAARFRPKAAKGHSGEHAEAVAQVVRHENFEKWLLDVKEKINAMQNDHAHINVFCICKAGINRSPTCARILKEIFKSARLEVYMHHTCEWYWERRGVCDATCKQCCSVNMTELKKCCLAQALLKWWDL